MLLLHPPVPPWLVRRPAGVELSLLTDQPAPAQVWLRSLADNEQELLPMQPAGRSGALHRWTALLPWDRGNPTTRYAFKAAADGRMHWLAADGLHRRVPAEAVHFRIHPDERPPAWVRDQFFYQVFPDRFCRADPAAIDPALLPAGGVAKDWSDPIDFAHPAHSFWGGDLAGIEQQLPYLQDELGVTALYLNPTFLAGSNHRYDTWDYTQVDPLLGGNAALESLARAMRARGMRLVLDAVVNHTGVHHPWFDRDGRLATPDVSTSADSPYRGFYALDDAGRPLGWKGHDSLPVLDFASPAVCDAVYRAPDSVLRRWLQPPYAIDGWRLDVIHMLGEGPGARHNARHVRAFRRAMREENPDAYVLGEHFAEATRWLQGEQEDGAMNYHGFTHPLRAWLGAAGSAGTADGVEPLPSADFERWLAEARAGIPWDNQLAQLNLLDSHDTARLLTLLQGDLGRMRLALALLFTSPGVPCLYYGDEIGLEGGADPDCRRPFPWQRERWNHGLLRCVQRLARWRRQRCEWRRGAVQTLAVGEHHFVFARCTDAAVTVVAVNRGPAVTLDLPLGWLPLTPVAWHEDEVEGTAPARLAAGGSGTPADEVGVPCLPPTHVTLPACSARLWFGDTAPRVR
jgi:alpha-glucosidase